MIPPKRKGNKMKLLTTKNKYQASNVYCEMNPELTELCAYSYDWWRFVAMDSVGNVIFNNTSYSPTTGQHQSKVSNIIKGRLGLRIALELYNTRESIEAPFTMVSGYDDSIKAIINSEIKGTQKEIQNRLDAISKPRTHKKKNEQRAKEVTVLEYRIKDLERYRDEYIGKKTIPGQKFNSWDLLNQWRDDIDDEKDCPFQKARVAAWQKYFLKPNGVLKRNEFQEFHKYIGYAEAPESVDAIKELFGLKSLEQYLPILKYVFANDLNNQIPHIDSAEYQLMQKWLKKQGINKTNINPLAFDKLHVYLTNLENKKDYTPSEPKMLPVLPQIAKLEGTKDLRIIDTEGKLRAEGRRQSHCIGGRQYIEQCRQGYQALNYKGYTFFYSPECELIDAYGKYNAHTPDQIITELNELIAA